MTTEVRIRRHRSYLPYLRTVVSCIAGGLGMTRPEIEEAQGIVDELCLRSIDSGEDVPDHNLLLRLAVQGDCMMIEVLDPSARSREGHLGAARDARPEHALHQNDLEWIESEEGITVRITRHARVTGSGGEHPGLPRHLSSLTSAHSQA